MAKRLGPLSPDFSKISREIDEFQSFLSSKTDFHEKKDIQPFFRNHPQLCGMIAIAHNIWSPDSIDFEHDLFGDFRPDLIVGSLKEKSFCFVEFEDAKPTSLLKATDRATTVWANRFTAAYFQIVDWFWKLDDQSVTAEFKSRFGDRAPNITPIIIVGRSASIDEKDRRRLKWVTGNVLIKTSKVFIYTFDDLYTLLSDKFGSLPIVRDENA